MNRKKILLISCRFFPPREGGELTIFEQLQYLVAMGYACTALHFRNWDGSKFKKGRVFKYKGIKIVQAISDSDKYIRDIIVKENPCIIYTHSFPAPRALAIAKQMGKKTILGIYSLYDINNVYTGKNISYEIEISRSKNPALVFKLADSIVTPSIFIEKIVKRFVKNIKGKRQIKTIYPVSPLNRIKTKKHSGTYVTMLNPVIGKGVFLVAALAVKLPNYQFLLVGKPSAKDKKSVRAFQFLRSIKNITLWNRQKDIRKIYERTRILLVPSFVEESFGRVAWEAMANGIPVLANNKGNLPLLVKNGGYICDSAGIDTWCKKINSLMEDQKIYKEKSRNAVVLSRKYNYEKEAKKLYDLVEKMIKAK